MNESNFFVYQTIITRIGIIILYLVVLSFFLYTPCIYNYFFENKNTLQVYAFLDVIAPEMFEEFEKKTGTKVVVNYFETNEELFAKFKINRGTGYDLILASDYMIDIMRKDGMLAKLNHAEIHNGQELDERLLNRDYDPENKYSYPVCWIPYGIGYNKNEHDLSQEHASWDFIFKPSTMISMLDDARESVSLASIYRFGKVGKLNDNQFEEVKQILIRQKPFVEAYVESGAQYLLLSDIVSIAVFPAARMNNLMKEDDRFEFVVPTAGSLLTIENLAIPAASEKQELAHELLNFLLSRFVGAFNFESFGFNPSNKLAYKDIDQSFYNNKSFFPDDKVFSRLYTIGTAIPDKKLEELWFSVKTA